jgi:hypothetical protein
VPTVVPETVAVLRSRISGRKGDTWLRGSVGQAANAAARTDTFLGERYHRIARRRGKAKAQVAVARTILVTIWHLLRDPETRYTDLGHGYYQAAPTQTASSATTSARSRPSASKSPSPRPPNPHNVPDQARPPHQARASSCTPTLRR